MPPKALASGHFAGREIERDMKIVSGEKRTQSDIPAVEAGNTAARQLAPEGCK